MGPLDSLQAIWALAAAFLGWVSASWWGLENIYPCEGLQWMLLLVAAAQQAAHPCIMPPNGSSTGKCQSQDFGIYNMKEAKKHLGSVSPLSLTQHIAKGTSPLCRTSSGVSHATQSAGEWGLTMIKVVNMAWLERLLSFIYQQPLLACETSPFIRRQNTLTGPAACTHRTSAAKLFQWARYSLLLHVWFNKK